MSLMRTALSRLRAAVFATLALGSAAMAACSDLSDPSFTDIGDLTVSELQLSLREVYQDTNGELNDGRFGPYTRSTLAKLCRDVPRPEGNNPVASTLALVSEYLDVQKSFPDWFDRLDRLDLSARGDVTAQQALGLRLAATIPMKTMAMGRRALAYDCTDPRGALDGAPVAARALGALTRLFRDKSEQEICQMMPVTSAAADWQAAMTRLGIINSRRAGGLQVLHNKAFLNWIDTPGQRDLRLRRLTGTIPAVLTLIDDFNTQNNTGDGTTGYQGGPCSPRITENTLTFYALDRKDVEALDLLVTLRPKLDTFREEQGAFDSPQALWQALRPELATELDDCILREIAPIVTGPENLPLAFLLKPTATERLTAEKALETAIPVLDSLADARWPTKAELINRVKADLLDVQTALIGADVAKAADTLAAGAEPAAPITDTALLDLDTGAEPDPSPRITVTDATDQAVATAVDNPELVEQLRNTPMTDTTNAELIRSQARAATAETAAAQVRQAVDAQIALIETAVTSEWTLTEALRDEILALPFVTATMADATADGAAERLAPLVGTSYPSHRLFAEALRTVSDAQGKVSFSHFVSERITAQAQKSVEDPHILRDFGPLEIDDCKCAPERQSENLQVYGFYPFWLAPKPTPKSPADPAPEAAKQDPPKAQTLVDFGTTSQLAFYGLEFSNAQSTRVSLRNKEQWRVARRNFVNSAHQYRARADLAFDLRDWINWDDATIDDVVEDIAIEMAAFERVESYELRHIGQAIPTVFDPVQPDGATLIFHDYQGRNLAPAQMKKMIRIIKSVYEALPDSNQQRINVGFDFSPDIDFSSEQSALENPIFDELFELLLEKPYIRADEDPENVRFEAGFRDREEKKVIDKILLFLERPTTDSKKGLRFRMERGLFQGELRRQVLRSIIPVVPPGGHELVLTSVQANAPDKSEPPAFSQFEDDVVYFKDNFAGIGFWPVLDPTAPQTAIMNSIIAKHFNSETLPPVLASFARPIDTVCTYACPNRAKIALAAMALFAVLILLTWRSFYSGFVDWIAFRIALVGVVWIGNVILVATLFVLAGCDPFSVWPEWLLRGLIVVLGVILFYNFVQRIKNGPPP